MSRLLRRIRPARSEPDAPSAAPDSAAGDVVVDEPQPSLPAGVAPEEMIGDPPDTRRRGRLRRRLRHLRQVRELMLRDVGGLVYEFHRAGAGSAPGEPGAPLVSHKLDRLTALDEERRALEAALDDPRAETVLREPGVGGACPVCGEYFASDARFCSRCGARVDGRAHAANDSSRDATTSVPAQGHTPAVAQAGASAPDREGARS